MGELNKAKHDHLAILTSPVMGNLSSSYVKVHLCPYPEPGPRIWAMNDVCCYV